jgi:PAS domain S-box-containing protein
LISPDGSEIILDSEWHLMRDKKGGPESVMAVCEDITELRRLEELEANRE